MSNNTTRFSGKGEIYAKARPKYAAGLMKHLQNTLNIPKGSIFADIGSGTGIFSEQLLNCGYTVYGVEPNEDMRRQAEKKLSEHGEFHSVDGTDMFTSLEDGGVDNISVAQAFHWFSAEKFKTECRRILRPGGRVFIVYNSRDMQADCNRALAELRKKYDPDFRGFSNGISDEACRAFFDDRCDVLKWDNSITYDREGYIKRLLSSSYSLKETDDRYQAYLDDIAELFEKFSVNGALTVPMNTVVYIGAL